MENNTNYNNNNFVQVHTNTNSIDMYSGDTRLSINLYDKSLSVSITNATTIDGKRRFPKESAVTALFTADRASAFAEVMSKEFLVAKSQGIPYQMAMPTNKDITTIVKMEYNPETDESTFYILSGIDGSRKATKISSFTFQKTIMFSKYNPETGDFEKGKDIDSFLIMFLKSFDDFSFNISLAATHFYKYDRRFENQRMMELIQALATKFGVQTYSRNSNTGATYANNAFEQPMNIPTTETTSIGTIFE